MAMADKWRMKPSISEKLPAGIPPPKAANCGVQWRLDGNLCEDIAKIVNSGTDPID
jgi:hypothetical protein